MFLNWTPICLFTLGLKSSMLTVIQIYEGKFLLFGKEGLAALNLFWLKIYADMISEYIIYCMTPNWIIPHIFCHYSHIFTRVVPLLIYIYTLWKYCFTSFLVHTILRIWFLNPQFDISFLYSTNISNNH